MKRYVALKDGVYFWAVFDMSQSPPKRVTPSSMWFGYFGAHKWARVLNRRQKAGVMPEGDACKGGRR